MVSFGIDVLCIGNKRELCCSIIFGAMDEN